MPRILLLDDNRDMRMSLRLALLTFGYACDDAETAAEALELLGHTDYDAAVLDLVMPDESPRQVFDWCLALRIPTLAVTGMSKPLASRYVPAGTEILEKPLDLVAFEDILGGLVDRRRRPESSVHNSDACDAGSDGSC